MLETPKRRQRRIVRKVRTSGWWWRSRSVTLRVTRVTHTVRHACVHVSTIYVARVMAVFRPPRARSIGTRAWRRRRRSLARSLDCVHAVWRWRWQWRWRSVPPRVHASRTLRDSCVTRVRECVIYVRRVRHHRFPFLPAHDRHARVAAALARSLARLIARALCGVADGGGGSGGLRRA